MFGEAQIFLQPDRSQWKKIVERPALDHSALHELVSGILTDVRNNGDEAVLKYTQQFDGVTPSSLTLQEAEWAEAASISTALKQAIELAVQNIKTFHAPQLQEPMMIETMTGIQCWRKSVPIEKVGLYIPGGSAPLFSTLLMLAVPATMAGCKEIVLCTPPNKEGKIHPAILYAAKAAGVHKIIKAGGVQAIAAMAYGTPTVPKVHKIFGPGNQYVTCAKQLVQMAGVSIDMPAGPSEVAVFADEFASPAFIAADLLSQAEHGADSQVLLVTTAPELPQLVLTALENQLAALPRKALAQKALQNSKIVVVASDEEAMDLLNTYAPEHLILSCKNALELTHHVVNAGSVFVGYWSPESVGDYASGTNHTLPTNGYATAYSGVSIDSFVKKITFQQLNAEGLKNIGPAVMTMAEAEGLQAHAHAVEIRLNELNNNVLRPF